MQNHRKDYSFVYSNFYVFTRAIDSNNNINTGSAATNLIPDALFKTEHEVKRLMGRKIILQNFLVLF
jgi:hypothetical protein